MPANRNALIRYKTIDACLRNRRRKWTLEDLIDKVSDVLYEYEGMSKGISRRTIQADIQMMRSDKLGYNAPIIIVDKKYYTYEDAEYSIMMIPLSEQDLGMMNDAIQVLKQFKGFSHFNSLNEAVQKLEDHVYAEAHRTSPVIDFEKNEQLKGLNFLDVLYTAIINEQVIEITYQSFVAYQPGVIRFHPWWLKEFKNRWFIVGISDNKPDNIVNLALDRIQNVNTVGVKGYIRNTGPTVEEFYKDVIGVTVSPNQRVRNVQLLFNKRHAPYVITKPLHHSQQLLEDRSDGCLVSIKVQINFELEKEILGFGDGVTVLAPLALRKRIAWRLKESIKAYANNGEVN